MRDFKVYQASGMLNFLVSDASDVRKKEQTLSGDIVSFNADAAAPVKIVVDIDSTGWTGANVSNTGVNLFDKSRFSLVGYSLVTDQNESNYGYYYGIIRNLGVNSNAFNRDNGGFLGFSANGRITFSCDLYNVGSRIYARFYYTDGTYSDGSNAESGFTGHYTATSSANKICTYVIFGTAAGATARLSIKNVQIQYGETETEYEEFGTTYPISWQSEAGTITEGTLTIDYDGSVTLETGGQIYTLQSISPIETLIGDNNIWADAGPVSVTYPI